MKQFQIFSSTQNMWGISYFGIIIYIYIYIYMKKLDLSHQAATTIRVTTGIIRQMTYFERCWEIWTPVDRINKF